MRNARLGREPLTRLGKGGKHLLRRRSKIIEQWQFSSRLNFVGRIGMLHRRQLVECGICGFRRHAFVNFHENHRATRRLERALEHIALLPQLYTAAMKEKRHVGTQCARHVKRCLARGTFAPSAAQSGDNGRRIRRAATKAGLERNMLFDMNGNMPLFVAELFSKRRRSLVSDVAFRSHIQFGNALERRARHVDREIVEAIRVQIRIHAIVENNRDHIVQRQRLHNRFRLMETVGAALTNFELQIHLRGGKHRESLFHVIAFLFLAAARFEEFRKHGGALTRKHARLNLERMVEAFVGMYRIQRPQCARLGIGRAVHASANARLVHKARAHNARLERDIHRAVGKTPAFELARRLHDSGKLRMRRWVGVGLSMVARLGDNLTLAHHHSTYGYLALVCRAFCLLKGCTHEALVVFGNIVGRPPRFGERHALIAPCHASPFLHIYAVCIVEHARALQRFSRIDHQAVNMA